ncbi:MAG: acyltransferase [Lachnospiraceae bacterium]|nr:acyltransferase [Lachnospiraceae bacterium]
MSVLVILIHSINNETRFEKFFSIDSGIGQFAVPLFFIISGFLFFRNLKYVNDAVAKLKRRVYTLLIPYLLWNLIYYAIHLLLKPGNGISMGEIIDAAFTYKYNPSFWFMYQLILLSIISPILYYLFNMSWKNKQTVKWLVTIVVVVAAELAIATGIDIPYLNEDAFVYYVCGYFLAYLYNSGRINFISKKNILICLLIFVFTFVFNRYIYHLLTLNPKYLNPFISTIVIVRLFGAVFLFYFFDMIFSYDSVPKFMSQTFFLYAIHYMIVKAMIIMMKFLMYKFVPVGIIVNGIDLYTIIECIVFILSPVVCVIINYHLSRFMMEKFSKQYNVLVGNRR